MSQFAVIGLGSFGNTVALELAKLNHEVIGIDINKKNIEDISDHITYAVIADATDENVLKELNLQKCSTVIVAIGEDIEASILCVLHLQNMGIKDIWAKAKTKSHHMILSHFNITKIIHPEEDMGVRVAQALNYPMVSRYMALDHDHYIVKVVIPPHLHGVNLLGIVSEFDVHIVLLKRNEDIYYHIDPLFTLNADDLLILEGHLDILRKLSHRFLKNK